MEREKQWEWRKYSEENALSTGKTGWFVGAAHTNLPGRSLLST